MSSSDVTQAGIHGARPDREAVPGGSHRRRRGRAEQAMVPDATFRSYYGLPVINPPVWSELDIAGYIYLGGLAGASAVLGAAADLTGRDGLAKVMHVGSTAALGLGTVGLVHDLGKPARFANMLRVAKPTSPMSVGSWLLSAFGPATMAAALTGVTGWFSRLGRAGSLGAAGLGPAVAAYTAVLLSDTAVPAWHEGHRELPFVFVGSAATAAAGLGLLAAPRADCGPLATVAVGGAAVELGAARWMEHRMGWLAEPYKKGRSGRLFRAAEVLTVAGAAGGVASLLRAGRPGWLARASGAALLTGSLLSRLGVFEAGMASAKDPAYTVRAQRARLAGADGQRT